MSLNLARNFSQWRVCLTVSVLLIVLSACNKEVPPPEPLRPVLTVVVGEMADEAAPVYSGEVRSRFETPLAFRIPGKISARSVDVGALVKPGQVLAQLDPADTSLSAAAAGAQLALADAEAKRYRELRGKKFVSQAVLDGKETTLTAAQSQADLARNQSAYTVLRTDQAGVVSLVSAEVGQVVSAGQTMFRVARSDTLEVAISIPESRMSEVRGSREADVSLWADEKATYLGILRELSPVADPLTRTYAARVAIVKPGANVLLGMTANVRFIRSENKGQLTVPLTALFQQDGKAAVWRVNADQTLALQAVEVAAYSEKMARLSTGVKAGERIVAAGVHKLTAGEKIKIAGQVATK
jgi:RND family efflux transporter MFP subunit